MSEYIERKALYKALTTAAVNDKFKSIGTWAKAICVLHDLPAADVAPVVRCKDCAYTREKDEYESVYLGDECVICTNSEYGWQPVWPNHFCGYGKRKDEAQNE